VGERVFKQQQYHVDDVVCRVFIDGSYHGEMKASAAADVNGYQYSVEDLNPGQTYDVAVRVRTHCCRH